jgi:hypothetical protein
MINKLEGKILKYEHLIKAHNIKELDNTNPIKIFQDDEYFYEYELCNYILNDPQNFKMTMYYQHADKIGCYSKGRIDILNNAFNVIVENALSLNFKSYLPFYDNFSQTEVQNLLKRAKNVDEKAMLQEELKGKNYSGTIWSQFTFSDEFIDRIGKYIQAIYGDLSIVKQ